MVTNNKHYWEKFGFFGGQVFLDFINTYDDLNKNRNLDALPDWNTVVRWSNKVGLLKKHEAQILVTSVSITTGQLKLSELHQFREFGWRVLSNSRVKKTPDMPALNGLNQYIQRSYSQSSLVYRKNAFSWVVDVNPSDADVICWRLGLFAGELLSTINLDSIIECGSCTGLFINKGRGVGRRWCRMNTCGNRAKIRKFRSGKETKSK